MQGSMRDPVWKDNTMANDLGTALAYGRIDAQVCETLRAVWPLVEREMTAVLDVMYAHILQQPELKALFANPERMQSAQDRQAQHWKRLFSGRYDQDYVASVEQIAATHARIGLQPSFYISACSIALA